MRDLQLHNGRFPPLQAHKSDLRGQECIWRISCIISPRTAQCNPLPSCRSFCGGFAKVEVRVGQNVLIINSRFEGNAKLSPFVPQFEIESSRVFRFYEYRM